MRIRYFTVLFSLRFANHTKSYQKVYMRRKIIALEIHQRNFVTTGGSKKLDYQLRLCDMLIQENVRKLFKLEDDFGQVIRKTKANVNFL